MYSERGSRHDYPFFVGKTAHANMEQLADQVAQALQDKGWCVLDDALPEALASTLAAGFSDSPEAFKPAGVGRRADYQRDASVRSDVIRWLEPALAADAAYLALMESLRVALNRRLFLGLFDYESHYARYAPGAFYDRHLDAFAGAKSRVLSTVFYLNADWRKEEGGELLLYAADGADVAETVLPLHNRLVIFLSERFPHEVKPATRVRHSIAGWFRVRA
jgi:SM-20-related protein